MSRRAVPFGREEDVDVATNRGLSFRSLSKQRSKLPEVSAAGSSSISFTSEISPTWATTTAYRARLAPTLQEIGECPESAFRSFVNAGIDGYDFTPGEGPHFGGNAGAGVLRQLHSHWGLQASHNFHAINTPGTATKFSTAQVGIQFVF